MVTPGACYATGLDSNATTDRALSAHMLLRDKNREHMNIDDNAEQYICNIYSQYNVTATTVWNITWTFFSQALSSKDFWATFDPCGTGSRINIAHVGTSLVLVFIPKRSRMLYHQSRCLKRKQRNVNVGKGVPKSVEIKVTNVY